MNKVQNILLEMAKLFERLELVIQFMLTYLLPLVLMGEGVMSPLDISSLDYRNSPFSLFYTY